MDRVRDGSVRTLDGLPGPVGSGRIERLFAGLGLAATTLVLLAALLALDLALTPAPSRYDVVPGNDFMMVSSDGRELGWATGDLRIVFTPGTLYEHEPGQVVGPYRINSSGLRGVEVADRPVRRRVVVTGGSATFGLGVDEEVTFVSRLGAGSPATSS